MSDDRCGATVHMDNSLRVCNMSPGHLGDHRDRDFFTWNPLVQPLQSKSREAQWAELIQAADGNRDELILRLFERVEKLEQGAANGAATDDMFATTNRAVEGLAGGMDRLTQRVRDLEKAAAYSTGPHDLSALQASIENHINRALTEFGRETNTQFERLNGAICTVNGHAQQQYTDMVAKLNSIWKVLAAMAPIMDTLGSAGHEGVTDLTGHPEECHGEVCVKCVKCVKPVPDGAQTERASGSPAAVRCPERFREGQCLGYAGHDGDCSAVPGSGNEQLEDPREFRHTTDDRSSDGTPIEF